MSEPLQAVKFDFIRYANCWEDAELLVRELGPLTHARVLSIASAGDNSFSLLAAGAQEVVAVDLNPVQLKLVALKKAAIREFDQRAYLEFMGFRDAPQRKKLWQHVKGQLNREDREFWSQRETEVVAGLAHGGKFERYFQLFVRKVLPFIHPTHRVEELLREKSAAEQQAFYTQRWNTWRWKLLFRLFFSRWVMGRLGRDPAFLKEVEVAVGTTIYQQAARHLASVFAPHNWMLRYALTADFGSDLPHFLQPEIYPVVRANLSKLTLVHGSVEAACTHGSFHAFNLSNIFEYLPEATCREIGETLLKASAPGAKWAYWNLMVPRSMAAWFPDRMTSVAAAEYPADRGFFYRQLQVDQLTNV
ncbi:MAG: DUF3419 family protein [Salibacteraceae bacterium]